MKKTLLIALCFSSLFLFSQINMAPQGTHYNDPYQVTISGNGTIYYTTNGTTPTLNSNSGINSLQITIDQNKEIKAFLVDGQGSTSAIFTKKYYTGMIQTANIYFKVPSSWTNGSCAMIDMVNPNSINGFVIDTFWPGFPMTNTGCEGWYKLIKNFENANISFNNCTPVPNIPTSISTNMIPMGSTIYYDFTNGEISTPPSCLFLNTDETKTKNIALIKVYPNPVSDVLKINSTKIFKDYEIIDTSGKTIFKNQITTNEVSINHLASGNYFIKLKDQEGNVIFLKFIKK